MGSYKQQPSTGGGASNVATLIDLDFSSVAADDWSANTAGADVVEVVDGVNITTNRHSTATAWGPDGSNGIDIDGTGGSYIQIENADLGSYDPALHRLVVQLTLSTSGLSLSLGNVTLSLRSADDNELFAHQFRDDGADYGFRLQTSLGGASTARGMTATQAGAPAAARMEMVIAEPGVRVRGDLDAGVVVPAAGTLAELDGGSRIDRATANADITSPRLRVLTNPGSGAVITLVALRVLRYTL